VKTTNGGDGACALDIDMGGCMGGAMGDEVTILV